MARIFTYNQDPSLDINDKLIGSNSEDNVTKNFTIDSLLDLANDVNAIKNFDGIVFKALDYNVDSSQYGIITTSTGVYTSTNFSSIQTIHLSNKNFKNEDVSNYIAALSGYDVRITAKSDVNNFGIYRVDSVATSGTYTILTLTVQNSSGQLTKNTEYYVSTLGNNLQNLNSFSANSLNDITSAGSGAIITDAERVSVATIGDRILYSDIQDNLQSTLAAVPLSANQGRILKGGIDTINTLLASDNVNLDDLQEVVDFIEANKTTLDALSISNIAGLQTSLSSKVDVIAGKELSANDFTDALLTKLNNIEASAEVNVQSNWSESNTSADDFIKNKPTDLTNLSTHNVTELNDITNAGSGAVITSAERTKLTNLAANAEQNVQSNWTETDTNDDSFIQNKPTILDQSTTLNVAGTTNEISVAGGVQNLTTNRTWTVGLPDDVTIGNDLTVTGDTSTDNIVVDDVLSFTTAQTSVTQDNAIYYKTEDGYDVLNFRYHDQELPIDTITEGISTGITSGGILSKNNNTQFTITAGSGIINDLNKESAAAKPHPEIIDVNWSQQTINCSGLDSGSSTQKNTWIYIDVNGVINQQASNFTDAQKSNNIIIGSVIHTSGTIDFVKTFPITAYGSVSQIQEFTRIFGPLKKSGHSITANGANLKLNRSSGVAWSTGRNYTADPNNPSIVSDTSKASALIHRYYSDGSTSHTLDSNNGTGYADINPGSYDDGSGTLASVSSGHFTVQRLFYFPTTPDIIVAYYGKNHYTSIDEARKNYLLEDFTEAENTAAQAIYLGAIVLKGNATALNNAAQAKILTSGIFRSLSATSLGGSSTASSLSDLSDVTVSSPTNNQFLKYNSSNGLFENASVTSDNITEGSTNLYDKTVAIANGDNISVSGTYPNFTVASAHPNISAATSADNSGLTFLQDLTLDSNGHVTGLVSTTVATEAIADGGTGLANADQIHTFVTGLGYLTANQSITLTGDITGSGATSISTTIAASSVHHAMLNDDIISGQAALTSGLASTDEFAISDDGVVKKMDVSVLQSYLQTNLTFTSNTDADVTTANLATRLGQLTGTNSIGGNVTVAGNLIVSGTTTTVNSETVTINDNTIVLNNNETGTPSENGGIEIERGTATNASLIWNETADKWYAGVAGSEVQLLTTADEGAGNGLDADTLDGQQGAHYLAYANFTGTPTIPTVNNNTITLTAGTGLSGGQAFTVNQSSDETITFDLDFSELTDMTADIGASTEFILQNSATESRKTANEISLKYFRNDIAVSVSGGVYVIRGYNHLGVTLQPGFKYRFTHPSAHPLRFSTTSDGTHNSGSAYTTGVTTSSTYTEITVEQDTPSTLYYYCSNHANMGGTVYIGSGLRTAGSGLTGTRTVALNLNGLSAETTIADADAIVFYDATASAHKKITKANFVSQTSLTGGNGVTINSNAIDNDADQRSVITHLGATTSDYYRSINTGVHEWYGSGALNMQLEDDGDLLVRQDVVAFSTVVASDKKLKDNIKTIHKGLDTVNNLRGVEFDWNYGNKKGQHDIGVVAQEVEKVIPEIVYSKKDIDGGEFKTVDYQKLTAVLIEAVKELSQEVTELKKQING